MRLARDIHYMQCGQPELMSAVDIQVRDKDHSVARKLFVVKPISVKCM